MTDTHTPAPDTRGYFEAAARIADAVSAREHKAANELFGRPGEAARCQASDIADEIAASIRALTREVWDDERSELDKLLEIENQQDRFEVWMASGNYPEITDVALERLPDGQYKSQLTFAAWETWKAASRMYTIEATRAIARPVPDTRAAALEEVARWHEQQATALDTNANISTANRENFAVRYRTEADQHRKHAASIRVLKSPPVSAVTDEGWLNKDMERASARVASGFQSIHADEAVSDAMVEAATVARERTEQKFLMAQGHKPGDYGLAAWDEYLPEHKAMLCECMRAALTAAIKARGA